MLHSALNIMSVVCLGTSSNIVRSNEIIGSAHGKAPTHLTDFSTLKYSHLLHYFTTLFNLSEDTVRYAFDSRKWNQFRPRWMKSSFND